MPSSGAVVRRLSASGLLSLHLNFLIFHVVHKREAQIDYLKALGALAPYTNLTESCRCGSIIFLFLYLELRYLKLDKLEQIKFLRQLLILFSTNNS